MTDQEHNIAVAEACGWRIASRVSPEVKIHACMCWIRPGGEEWQEEKLPDFGKDLNAMAEAEKTLLVGDAKQIIDATNRYTNELRKILQCFDTALFQFTHATAAQRREAFLRTLGLWKA